MNGFHLKKAEPIFTKGQGQALGPVLTLPQFPGRSRAGGRSWDFPGAEGGRGRGVAPAVPWDPLRAHAEVVVVSVQESCDAAVADAHCGLLPRVLGVLLRVVLRVVLGVVLGVVLRVVLEGLRVGDLPLVGPRRGRCVVAFGCFLFPVAGHRFRGKGRWAV